MGFCQNFDLSVYFVADPSVCGGRDIAEVVRAGAEGGTTLVQYRDKTSAHDVVLNHTKSLGNILRPYGVPLIVNDYVDVALAAGADGVHLGQDDMSPVQAREILGPEAIIGVTAFTGDQITAVDPKIVDYIGLGPFYPTKTEKGKTVLGPEGFKKLAVLSPVPVVGIGGITPDNAAVVLEAGAAGVAMMRAISEAEDPERAAGDFAGVVQSVKMRQAS